MPPIRMDIILYAQTGCAINSCTKINNEINFELNTQNFLPPIVTAFIIYLLLTTFNIANQFTISIST